MWIQILLLAPTAVKVWTSGDKQQKHGHNLKPYAIISFLKINLKRPWILFLKYE